MRAITVFYTLNILHVEVHIALLKNYFIDHSSCDLSPRHTYNLPSKCTGTTLSMSMSQADRQARKPGR